MVKLDSSHQSVKAVRDKRKVENIVERATEKENCTEDSDSNPSVVSRDVLEVPAIGVGELATRKRSVGLNKSETFVNGRTQRRKGKVTASPRARVKG